jgi:uncharacterized protein YjbI with pentapeptide repeats
MANAEHVAILNQGAPIWNKWRKSNPETRPALREADLKGIVLPQVNLVGATLRGADFAGANLNHANFTGARMAHSSFEGANISGANFMEADLTGANFRGANLSNANLMYANLTETNFESANLSNCRVYGIAAWNLQLEKAEQSDLIITRPGEAVVTVDNLEVAQFIYLLLNNKKIRDVIDTVTSKVVLILGRFTPERKQILDAIREELRKRDYLPVLFDFDKPNNRDITETVATLAHMSCFCIADITDAKSIPQELMLIVPDIPSLPVQPILLSSQQEYGMFEHFRRYPWVLEIYFYESQEVLLTALEEKVIRPIELKLKELLGK